MKFSVRLCWDFEAPEGPKRLSLGQLQAPTAGRLSQKLRLLEQQVALLSLFLSFSLALSRSRSRLRSLSFSLALSLSLSLLGFGVWGPLSLSLLGFGVWGLKV